ncbi:hypothetical protein M569_10622 [Genlisea aurea]|uniref:WPP domain-containing protein n=1 Tax=Genlisea aurea TaxID=192259 RepID=S8CBC8_9LAMI|nr:hypothetical protein M569_10622 [Genlisea aurea]
MAAADKSPPERMKTESTTTAAAEKHSGISSFGIWPPTNATRDGVRNLLIETLTSSSILPARRYSGDEAISAAKVIEKEAFDVAAILPAADHDAFAILQAYSKQISLRIVDKVKARSGKTTAGPAPAPANGPTRKIGNTAVSS